MEAFGFGADFEAFALSPWQNVGRLVQSQDAPSENLARGKFLIEYTADSVKNIDVVHPRDRKGVGFMGSSRRL